MSEHLDIGREGALGVIALNRPEAINALSVAMIRGITGILTEWAGDASIRAVLFEGRGARGFCAGGDVRAIREMVLGGDLEGADRYFVEEYAMDRMIGEYGKPVIALTNGIIMGGGIGVAGHARFRLTSERARFAMPEAAIGLTCDIGVNTILAKVPQARALAFMMVGELVGAADALALGLTDVIVGHDRLEAVRGGIVEAAAGGDVDAALKALMMAEGLAAGEAVAMQAADGLGDVFALGSAAQIVAALGVRAKTNEKAAALAAAISKHCPTSLSAIVAAHRAARRDPDLGAVLGRDLNLAQWLVRRSDYVEGVRAVLVDKDRSPRWVPGGFDAVRSATIDRLTGHRPA